MITAAYPGVKAIFTNSVDPDIKFDVVLWRESGAEAIGLFVVPGQSQLYHPGNAPVPADYGFYGYAYCA